MNDATTPTAKDAPTDNELAFIPNPREVIYTSALTIFLSALAIIGASLEQIIILITFSLLMTISLLMRLFNVIHIIWFNDKDAKVDAKEPDAGVLILVFIIVSVFECLLIILSIKLAFDIKYCKRRHGRQDGRQENIDMDANDVGRRESRLIARDSVNPMTALNEISFADANTDAKDVDARMETISVGVSSDKMDWERDANQMKDQITNVVGVSEIWTEK